MGSPVDESLNNALHCSLHQQIAFQLFVNSFFTVSIFVLTLFSFIFYLLPFYSFSTLMLICLLSTFEHDILAPMNMMIGRTIIFCQMQLTLVVFLPFSVSAKTVYQFSVCLFCKMSFFVQCNRTLSKHCISLSTFAGQKHCQVNSLFSLLRQEMHAFAVLVTQHSLEQGPSINRKNC